MGFVGAGGGGGGGGVGVGVGVGLGGAGVGRMPAHDGLQAMLACGTEYLTAPRGALAATTNCVKPSSGKMVKEPSDGHAGTSPHRSAAFRPCLPTDRIEPKTSSAPAPRKRISRACDQCNQLRTKCDGEKPCAHCITFSLTCEYLRERKKRGKVSRKDLRRQQSIKNAGPDGAPPPAPAPSMAIKVEDGAGLTETSSRADASAEPSEADYAMLPADYSSAVESSRLAHADGASSSRPGARSGRASVYLDTEPFAAGYAVPAVTEIPVLPSPCSDPHADWPSFKEEMADAGARGMAAAEPVDLSGMYADHPAATLHARGRSIHSYASAAAAAAATAAYVDGVPAPLVDRTELSYPASLASPTGSRHEYSRRSQQPDGAELTLTTTTATATATMAATRSATKPAAASARAAAALRLHEAALATWSPACSSLPSPTSSLGPHRSPDEFASVSPVRYQALHPLPPYMAAPLPMSTMVVPAPWRCPPDAPAWSVDQWFDEPRRLTQAFETARLAGGGAGCPDVYWG
ncbi:MAG: hypothetical protein M1826_004445 [Phylliscum demangeonii]|nr:MAG: hypothetical protein M1826_004445 [Phylliscum demangeonii]